MSIRLVSRFGAVLASLGVMLACGKTENVSASDVVVQFYVTVEVSGVRDLPEPRALLALEPYLTDSLSMALRAARAVRDTASARSPGQAPPFSEGNPFSGFFEGHDTYVVRGAVERGDSAFVTVAFTNTEQKPPVSWADTVVLVKVMPSAAQPQNSAVWRVADLRYGTDWEFGYRGTLRSVLRR
ncbi:YqhG/Tai3 family protein [Gemmatimonas sp.]